MSPENHEQWQHKDLANSWVKFEVGASALTNEEFNPPKLEALAMEAFLLEERLADLDQEASECRKLLASLLHERIPEAMRERGVDTLMTESGFLIERSQFVEASMSPGKRIEAFDWLRNNGYEAIIKRTVSITYRLSDEYLLLETLEKLEEKGLTLRYTEDISPVTLRAFLQEMIVQGYEFPSEFFTLAEGFKGVVKRLKQEE